MEEHFSICEDCESCRMNKIKEFNKKMTTIDLTNSNDIQKIYDEGKKLVNDITSVVRKSNLYSDKFNKEVSQLHQSISNIDSLGYSKETYSVLEEHGIKSASNIYDVLNTLLESKQVIKNQSSMIEIMENCYKINKAHLIDYIKLPDSNGNNLIGDCIDMCLSDLALWILNKPDLYDESIINYQNNSKETPLLLACAKGLNTIVEKLLELPYTDLNLSCSAGRCPLIVSISYKNEEIINKLFNDDRINLYIKGYKNVNLISYATSYTLENFAIKLFDKYIENNRYDVLFEISDSNDNLLLLSCKHKCRKLANKLLDLFNTKPELFTTQYINCRDSNDKVAIDYCVGHFIEDIVSKIVDTKLVDKSVYTIYETKKFTYNTMYGLLLAHMYKDVIKILDQNIVLDGIDYYAFMC